MDNPSVILLIHHLYWVWHPHQVIDDTVAINVYIEQAGRFERKQMNGCAKNTKTKNAIISLNRRCFFQQMLFNKTPICLIVYWNDHMMLLIFYFFNDKNFSGFQMDWPDFGPKWYQGSKHLYLWWFWSGILWVKRVRYVVISHHKLNALTIDL